MPATLIVNSTADNTTDMSHLTLRDAITLVNQAGNPSSLGQSNLPAGWASQITGTFGTNDTILFDPSVTGTLTLAGTNLPQITADVTIDGPGTNLLTVVGTGTAPVFTTATGVFVAESGLSLQGSTSAVYTNQIDFSPGQSALISGSGFAPNENVTVSIEQLHGTAPGTVYTPLTVTTNATGSFQTNWTVVPAALFQVTATGSQGGTAVDQFTDGSVGVSPPPPVNPLVVTTTSDSNTIGSLRFAISSADSSGGTITFNIPTSYQDSNGSTFTIQPQSALPAIDSNVSINGASEATYLGQTYSTPLIVLNGAMAVSSTVGLTLSGSNSTIQGLVINDFSGDGIDINGGSNDTIQGNYIGTDYTSTVAMANAGSGVQLVNDAVNNTIGGTTTGAGNLISGNSGDGIDINGSGTTGNVVEGNYIGTDVTGTTTFDANSNPLGNGYDGVEIDYGATGNTVGGTSAGARNIISGNGNDGVELDQAGTSGNFVLGNYIGTGYTGTTAVDATATRWATAPASRSTAAPAATPSAARRRGPATSSAATSANGVDISDSGTTGNVVEGNYIGTDVTGTTAFDANGNRWATAMTAWKSTTAPAATRSAAPRPRPQHHLGNSNDGVELDQAAAQRQRGRTATTSAPTSPGPPPSATMATACKSTTAPADNTIGGTTAAARNIISGNASDGNGYAASTSSGPAARATSSRATTSAPTSPAPSPSATIWSGRASSTPAPPTTPSAAPRLPGNLISGNIFEGVSVNANDNFIQANYIGTDYTGEHPLGNNLADNFGTGGLILWGGSTGNVVGGTTTGTGNVISGNGFAGVNLADSGTSNNVIEGNLIGVDQAGATSLPNRGAGVYIRTQASGNTIGGTAAGDANVISGNASYGIQADGAGTTGVVENNYVGTGAGGSGSLPNSSGALTITNSADVQAAGTFTGNVSDAGTLDLNGHNVSIIGA